MEESGLVAALVLAQAEMEGAKKDKSNPHFKSKYATLESVNDAVKPALQKHGLAYIQKFHEAQGGVAVETIILHKSGEQLSNGILSVPASKQDAQGYGSAITYARRYSLQSAFGIAPEDDDGNAASGGNYSPKTSQPKQPYTPPSENITSGIVGASGGNSDMECVTSKQLDELEGEMKKRGVDVDKFLAYVESTAGVGALSQIPQCKFPVILAAAKNKPVIN